MRRYRCALGALTVVALACGASGASAEGAKGMELDDDAAILVAERSGVTSRLDETRSSMIGLKATLGLGFDRQPMSPPGHRVLEQASSLDRTNSSASMEIAAPLAFAFGRAVPTPFERSTQLSFDLPVTSRVRIESFDVRGREVKGALSEELDPGRYQRTWEAVDESGRSLPPGIYLLRIEASAVAGSEWFSAVRKLLLMR